MTFWTLFSDYTFQVVALGSALLGLLSGVIGSFAVLRKQSLLGDAVSHAALPGICLAFMITNIKQTEVLLIGALISGLVATWLIMSIVKYSKIKFDSALALITSVFFGLGMVFLTYIQKTPDANQAGLKSFIFGQSSTLLVGDVKWMLGIGMVMLVLMFLFWKEFKLIAFDEVFAKSIGVPVHGISILLSAMTVVTIIIGLQTVGVILMSSLLIGPAVAARQWTNRLAVMVSLAAVFGSVSGVLGTVISSLGKQIPTGPTIVVVISVIVLISLVIAPNRGMMWKLKQRRRQKKALIIRLNQGGD
ncbi:MULTISPECIES: metal ABC transporter permease [Carnobacterium]|uniref:Manganese import system permease protein ScaB n=1 Tax=Carnobacterium divergens TaxID=2748 RepID=A0A2R8A221_CARDV|nr:MULTISPECIES: iron chelate uptake ABC transporter family permease subunit [Carnobacterium]MCO6017360.1 metal ABC transporter permease [Carnobacterium divergens]MDT1939225.1 metal ABC transporter permease [Carnobacterium divergens]MDT1941663.1 metal ABC transporter permease [Carnobacterium divergens]MDT1947461.1 metal ABC transporter permease [Carnobacterium divergens]MDT1949900.1 metal ABC transporter permease [Carnobacterium divergens]